MTPPPVAGDPGLPRELDAAERSALGTFDSDDWMRRAARAAEVVALGEIAGYRIVRVVQRGAQGTVYEAVEPRSDRRVAIKRLPSLHEPAGEYGSALDSLEAARFAREIEALASLGHANVVALLAAPEADGARVIVMEWIDGAALDAWADAEWQRLAPRDAVHSVVVCHAKIASALAAAHARGIMHRDLKPSNVLVTGAGEPKVLDFGLAKEIGAVRDATRDATRTGGFAGTPSWAAPEQVAGLAKDIDARADVHALGLLLYRALAGTPAFDGTLAIGPLFEAIRTVTPPMPSRVSMRVTSRARRGIPRELDLITMRALEKDPARRYQTAEAFERDLRRYLAGEPIDAHPPSALYLARKFVARHRAATAATAIAIAAVLAGSVATAISAIEANDARNAAVARATEADRARTRAERMNGFFQDLLANLRERDAAGGQTSAREIIALAASSLEQRATSKEAEYDLRVSLGVALNEIGDYNGAVAQFRRARELLPDPANRAEYGRVLGLLAGAMQRADSQAELLEVARACATLRDEIAAPEAERAAAYESLASALSRAGRVGEAREAIERARKLAEQSHDALALANVLTSDSLLLQSEGRATDAAAAAIDAVAHARAIPDLPAPKYARFPHNAGYLLTECGRAPEALPYLEESLEVRARYFGPRHPALILARVQLAAAYRALGRHDDGVKMLEETLAYFDSTTSKPILARANLLRHLGRSYQLRHGEGDIERAIDTFRASAFELAAAGVENWPRLRSALKFLGHAIEARDGVDAEAAALTALSTDLAARSGFAMIAPLARLQLVENLCEAQIAKSSMAPKAPKASKATKTTQAAAGAGAAPHANPGDDTARVAQARVDATELTSGFGADTVEALEGELALARLLTTSTNAQLRDEGSALARSVLERSTKALGAGSNPARQAAALVQRLK